MSLNSLMVSILEKHVEWDKDAEKFGFVQVPGRILKSAFDKLKRPQIVAIADLHARLTQELVNFWFKDMSMENLIKFFQLNNKYSGLYQHEELNTSRTVTFILKHRLGKHWSEYLEAVASSGFKDILDSPPETEIFEDSISIKIPIQKENTTSSNGKV